VISLDATPMDNSERSSGLGILFVRHLWRLSLFSRTLLLKESLDVLAVSSGIARTSPLSLLRLGGTCCCSRRRLRPRNWDRA
jgi:hypothetical protein